MAAVNNFPYIRVQGSMFNTIYVLESRRKNDPRTGENLVKWLKLRSLKGDINSPRYVPINSRKNLVKALNKIRNDVGNGLYPIIHFEMHGSPEGLEAGDEIVPWENVLNQLRTINVETGHNLFVSFAVCHALFLYPEIDIFKHAPFFAFISSVNRVSFGTIQDGFQEFFEELLTSFDAAKALNKLNSNLSFAHEKFEFRYAQSFFEEVWQMYNKEWNDSAIKYKKIQNLMGEALQRPSLRYGYTIPGLRYALEQQMNEEGRAVIKEDMLRHFLIEAPRAPYMQNL